jgi:hypothetical protein
VHHRKNHNNSRKCAAQAVPASMSTSAILAKRGVALLQEKKRSWLINDDNDKALMIISNILCDSFLSHLNNSVMFKSTVLTESSSLSPVQPHVTA